MVRVFFIFVALIIVLGWFGFECREKDKLLSRVCFGFSGLFALMLIGAFFRPGVICGLICFDLSSI